MIERSMLSALRLKSQLENIDIFAELFEGVYGNEAEKLMEAEGRTLVGFKEGDPITKANSPGVKGCFYSHYNLWKKCVELGEPIMVLEDDVEILRPYIPVKWKDVLVVAVAEQGKKIKDYLKYLLEPSGEPKSISFPARSMPGTVGYVIKPKAAKRLVKRYSSTYLPSDNAMHDQIVDISLHNYMIGREIPRAGGELKSSLVRSKIWENFQSK